VPKYKNLRPRIPAQMEADRTGFPTWIQPNLIPERSIHFEADLDLVQDFLTLPALEPCVYAWAYAGCQRMRR